MDDSCQAHLPMQYASNLFAKGNSGVLIDSKEHLIRTCKQASCLCQWLSVFILAYPFFPFYTDTKPLIQLYRDTVRKRNLSCS